VLETNIQSEDESYNHKVGSRTNSYKYKLITLDYRRMYFLYPMFYFDECESVLEFKVSAHPFCLLNHFVWFGIRWGTAFAISLPTTHFTFILWLRFCLLIWRETKFWYNVTCTKYFSSFTVQIQKDLFRSSQINKWNKFVMSEDWKYATKIKNFIFPWPLVPKFAGSTPAESFGFLRSKKSSARLPSEGKWSRQSHVADLRHVKDP